MLIWFMWSGDRAELFFSSRPWQQPAGLFSKPKGVCWWWVWSERISEWTWISEQNCSTLCVHSLSPYFSGAWWFHITLLCHIGTREPSFSFWVFGPQTTPKWSVRNLQGERRVHLVLQYLSQSIGSDTQYSVTDQPVFEYEYLTYCIPS